MSTRGNMRAWAGQSNSTALSVSIGGNLHGIRYFDYPHLLVNAMQQGFDAWENDATPFAALTPDGNGDPPEDFRCTPHWVDTTVGATQVMKGSCTGFVDSITITTGSGRFSVSGKDYDGGSNTTTFDVNVAAGSQQNYHIVFTGTRRTGGAGGTPNTGVADLKITHPGYTIADVTTKVWTDEAITFLKQFQVHRHMDSLRTNDIAYVNWAAMPRRATHKKGGPTMEDLCDLANKTRSAPWFCIPHTFADSDVNSMADFVEANIDQGIPIYWELGNELWNPIFQASEDTLISAAVELKAFVGDVANGTNNRDWSWARTAGVVTITTGDDHLLSTGNTVYFTNIDAQNPQPTITVTGAKTFTFSMAGADVASTGALGNQWFVGNLDSTLRLGSTIGADGNVNIYNLANRWRIRRVKEISDLLRARATIGDLKMITRHRPLWAYQMGTDLDPTNGQFTMTLLDYIQQKFTSRTIPQYFYGIAGAPYFTAAPHQSSNTATETDIVNALAANCINAKNDYHFEEWTIYARRFGIKSMCYEGGPDVKGGGLTSQQSQLRNAAQFNIGLRAPVHTMLNEWFGLGGGEFCWYYVGILKPTDTSIDNSWGITDHLTNLIAPKELAFTDTRNNAPAVVKNIVPGTIDGRMFEGHYTATGSFPNWSSSPGAGTATRGLRIRYMVWTVDPAARQLTISYKYNVNFAHTFTLIVNGTQIGGATSLPVIDTTNTHQLAPISINLLRGFNIIELARDANQGADVEIRQLLIQ